MLNMLRWIAALIVIATPAMSEPDMRVLVDREPSGISVYFTTPAAALPQVFGSGAGELLKADGTVDIDGLYNGTYDTADGIFADVTAQIDGTPFGFEALSMMVHDPAILPAFETPFDAAMSIAVCNSPETVRNMGLNDLQAYLGFYAWKADPLSEVVLTFPKTDREEWIIEVLDYAPTGAIRRSTHELANGGLLVFTPLMTARYATLLPVFAGVLALAIVFGFAAAVRRSTV